GAYLHVCPSEFDASKNWRIRLSQRVRRRVRTWHMRRGGRAKRRNRENCSSFHFFFQQCANQATISTDSAEPQVGAVYSPCRKEEACTRGTGSTPSARRMFLGSTLPRCRAPRRKEQ